jgi:GNAT superfamily N-acetyltransferase
VNPGIEFREAVENDYEQLCQLSAELDSFHSAALPHIFQPSEGNAREKSFFFPPPDEIQGITYLAVRGNELLGFVSVSTKLSAPIPLLVPRKITVVDALYVAHSARRQGVAKALMAHAVEWAQSVQCSAIELTVYAFNDSALQFYKEESFEDLSRKMILRLK